MDWNMLRTIWPTTVQLLQLWRADVTFGLLAVSQTRCSKNHD